MSRRLHSCLTCSGKTRHRAVCGPCRRRGVTVVGHEITVPIAFTTQQVRLLPARPKNTHAPTLVELQAGIDLTPFLAPSANGDPA